MSSVHRISREQVIYAMSRDNPPVLTVDSGERLLFETCDCFQDQIVSEDTPFEGVDWAASTRPPARCLCAAPSLAMCWPWTSNTSRWASVP